VPGKESEEKFNVLPRIASLFIVGFILFLIIWRANEVLAPFAPTAFVQPTSTFLPNPELMGAQSVGDQWVDVVVSAQEANPFDPFDVNEVVVRVSNSLHTDDGADSRFLVPCAMGRSIYAWAPGYEIASVPCDGRARYEIELTHLKAADNSYYFWSAAANDCNICHGDQYVHYPETATPYPENDASYNEMNEWLRSAHATVFDGRYFESMYKGTSATGKPSIRASPVIIDNEWVPVPPERKDDYHGPGFKLDFPDQPGNCAYCHVPAAIQVSQDGVDLSNLFPTPQGAWGEGVTCDVCHKVFEVILADDKNPLPDRPGVLSYRFLRPDTGSFITGPFSNLLTRPLDGLNLVSNHRLACTPLFSQSEFCAPCHFGKFGDMVVYNSYGEWRETSFSKDPSAPGYRTCQDCHMSHMDVNDTTRSWSQRQACSANNLEFQNFDHNMMDFGLYPDLRKGTQNYIPRMVKGAAAIEATFGSEVPAANTLDVNVKVTNKKAGHKFPTDSPLRHLILVVKAQDRVLTSLIQVGGDRIPNWAGPGPISPISIANTLDGIGMKDYGGLPGKIFANLLVEEETNLSPGMAYWNETKHASLDSTNETTSDTRLVPGEPDVSNYSFAMPDEGDVRITVQLIYRFAFYDLVIWKEWFDRPDIVVAEVECNGPPREPTKITCRQVEPLIPAPTPTSAPTLIPTSTPLPTLIPTP
jgi:hypothetical protein